MDQTRTQNFKTAPSLAFGYCKAFAGFFTPHGKAAPEQAIHVAVDEVSVDEERLRKFCKLTDWNIEGVLPPTYPQTLAASIHLALLTDSHFPFALKKLVHLSSSINQYRAIETDEKISIQAWVDGFKENRRGQEFELHTVCRIKDRLVWDQVNKVLCVKAKKNGTVHADSQQKEHVADACLWQIPSSIGWEYARASGDFNPIHYLGSFAKAAGFKKPLAQGTWALSKCLARMADFEKHGAFQIEASFKKPIFVGSNVLFEQIQSGDSTQFSLQDIDANKPHLIGWISRL